LQVTDIVSPEKRSKMMAGIRGKDTKPEMMVRKSLHARGFRYRLHDRRMPGKPDLVLPKFKAVVFVHGCFWHGHECHLFKWPKSRVAFWENKIGTNRVRDQRNRNTLMQSGWRVAEIWECALRKTADDEIVGVIDRLQCWLYSSDNYLRVP
jgi:DNA mismatch endonuclease (patch repair protein)